MDLPVLLASNRNPCHPVHLGVHSSRLTISAGPITGTPRAIVDMPVVYATVSRMTGREHPRAFRREQSEFGNFALAVYRVLTDELSLQSGRIPVGVPWNLAI